MISVIQDGLFVFDKYWEVLFIFAASTFGLGWFFTNSCLSNEDSNGTKVAASISIGVVVLCLTSFLLMVLSYFLPFLLRPGSYAILFFAIFASLKGLLRGEIKFPRELCSLLMASAFFLLLLVRLVFIKQLILPPYSDSPVHYQIVQGILQPVSHSTSQLSLGNIFSTYYHFGFHSLTAWLVTLAGVDSLRMMPLVGQLFLVVAPVSIMLMVKVITGEPTGALFAGLLSTAGWYMPAFAANWGKYPALGALAALPAVVAFLVLWQRKPDRSSSDSFWVLVVVIGITVLHSRALVCLLLFALSGFIVTKIPIMGEVSFFQSVRYALLYVATLWPLRSYLDDYYGNWPVAVALSVLLPFAFYKSQRISMGIFFFTVGICLTVVIQRFLGHGFRELLDRQFLEMVMFIPFSIMGGAGLSGLIRSFSFSRTFRMLVFTLLFGLVLWKSPWVRAIYPDQCCTYFQEADRLAFQWLREHFKAADLILISSFDNQGQTIGTDAGGWIYPLLGFNTNKLSFDTNWTSPVKIEEICNIGAEDVYIYMGGRPYSFNASQLTQGEWMEEEFRADQTAIFRIPDCEKR